MSEQDADLGLEEVWGMGASSQRCKWCLSTEHGHATCNEQRTWGPQKYRCIGVQKASEASGGLVLLRWPPEGGPPDTLEDPAQLAIPTAVAKRLAAAEKRDKLAKKVSGGEGEVGADKEGGQSSVGTDQSGLLGFVSSSIARATSPRLMGATNSDPSLVGAQLRMAEGTEQDHVDNSIQPPGGEVSQPSACRTTQVTQHSGMGGSQQPKPSPCAVAADESFSTPLDLTASAATSAESASGKMAGQVAAHPEGASVSWNFLHQSPGLDGQDKVRLQEWASSSMQSFRTTLADVDKSSQQSDWHCTMLIHRENHPRSLRHPAIVSTTFVEHDRVLQDVGDKALLSGWQRRQLAGVSEENEFCRVRMVAIAESVRESKLFSTVELFLRTADRGGGWQPSSTRKDVQAAADDPLALLAFICRDIRREVWCECLSPASLHH